MRSTLFKFAITLFLTVPWSCEPYDCGPFEQQYTNIVDVLGTNVRLLEGGYSVEGTLTDESEVVYSQYGIRVLPQITLMSDASVEHTGGNRAFACSPPTPQPSELIASIAIFSDSNYSQSGSNRLISAGDTLNTLFNIYDYYSGRIVGLSDFLIDDDLAASEMGFVLQPAVAPSQPQEHQFTVHYRLDNGEFYELNMPAVSLMP